MASDRMMEYYYSMGQDCLHTGSIDDAVTYFRKAISEPEKRPRKSARSVKSWKREKASPRTK